MIQRHFEKKNMHMGAIFSIQREEKDTTKDLSLEVITLVIGSIIAEQNTAEVITSPAPPLGPKIMS